VVVNLAAFSVLAAAVLRDVDVRRQARDQHQAVLSESYIRLVKDLFVNFFAEFDFRQLNVGRLIGARYWEHARDAYISEIVDRLEGGVVQGDVGLNPLGSYDQDAVELRARAAELMSRAYVHREVQSEGNMVAFPLYAGRGSDREQWGAAYVRVVLPSLPAAPTSLSLGVVALALGGATVAAMGFVFLLMHILILQPLGRISEGALRVSRGDFGSPVEPTGRGDEIDALIVAFNSMMAEIGQKREALEQQVDEVVERMRLTERRLVLTDRLAAMGTLAAGIAHEINNPVGGMLNAVAALRRKDDLPERSRRYLGLVEDGLARIRDLVQRVLRFSPGRSHLEQVQIREVLEDAARFVRHRLQEARVQLDLEVEPSLSLRADRAALGQVFLNLLLNAVHAMEGEIRRIEVHASKEDRMVLIRVRDTGRGMTAEERGQAFNLFYTTREAGSGTGLGLSIVHQIITEHGGSVAIESAPGAGTEIQVRLPQGGSPPA